MPVTSGIGSGPPPPTQNRTRKWVGGCFSTICGFYVKHKLLLWTDCVTWVHEPLICSQKINNSAIGQYTECCEIPPWPLLNPSYTDSSSFLWLVSVNSLCHFCFFFSNDLKELAADSLTYLPLREKRINQNRFTRDSEKTFTCCCRQLRSRICFMRLYERV